MVNPEDEYDIIVKIRVVNDGGCQKCELHDLKECAVSKDIVDMAVCNMAGRYGNRSLRIVSVEKSE